MIVFRVERYLFAFEFLLNLALIVYFFPKEKLVFKSIRGVVFLIFIVTVPSLMPFPLFYRYVYRRPFSAPILPEKHTLPKDSLLVLCGSPTAIFIPFLVPDNSTPAILNPTYHGNINGSDFAIKGYYDKKRKEIFASYAQRPEKDIYYIEEKNNKKAQSIYKDATGQYHSFEHINIPCVTYHTISLATGDWSFSLCRQSLKNWKPDNKFTLSTY